MNDQQRHEHLKDFLHGLGMDNADPDLVCLALTHRSFSFEQGLGGDNERLEFLGDAVLGFIVSCYLYENNPEADEGFLSKRKARLVSRSILGRQAKVLGLGSLILLGKGEEMTGGRRRSSLLGSALEALIGALYLSCSWEQVDSLVRNKIIRPSEHLLKFDVFADYKSRLQEHVQKQFHCVPEYKLMDESGPDHQKSFRVEVFIQGKSYGVGYGSRIKVAENAAARIALDQLNRGI
jgi:ribonuclease-3